MNNRYKFVAAVIGMFLLPFLLLSRHFIYGEGELQRKDTLRYLELRTMTGSGIVSNVLNLNYSLSRLAASSAGTAAVKKSLSERVKDNPFIYSELALLSPAGKELAHYRADKSAGPHLDYARTQAFAEARRTGEPAGAVEYGEYTPPALVLAEPQPGSAQPSYFLAGRLSLGYVGEVVRMMGRNSYGSFGLIDGGGQVIADSRSMSIVKPGLKAPAEVLKIISVAARRDNDNFSSEVLFNGRTLLIAVSNVPGSKWWIYEIMDSADIPVRVVSSWAWRIVMSGVALIILFGLITFRLALYWLKEPGR